MACQDESVFVNNPLNLVQTTHDNKHSGEKAVCATSLNDTFAYERFKMDWPKMLKINQIVGSHQDMKVLLTDL
jgi:hypothetical protein